MAVITLGYPRQAEAEIVALAYRDREVAVLALTRVRDHEWPDGATPKVLKAIKRGKKPDVRIVHEFQTDGSAEAVQSLCIEVSLASIVEQAGVLLGSAREVNPELVDMFTAWYEHTAGTIDLFEDEGEEGRR